MSQKWVHLPQFSGWKETKIFEVSPPPRKTLDTTSPSSFLPVKPSSTSWNRFGFFCSCRIAKSVPPRMSWVPWWHEAGTSTISAKMRSSSTKPARNWPIWISCCLVIHFLGTSVPNLYFRGSKTFEKWSSDVITAKHYVESSLDRVRRFVPIYLTYSNIILQWSSGERIQIKRVKWNCCHSCSCQTNN